MAGKKLELYLHWTEKDNFHRAYQMRKKSAMLNSELKNSAQNIREMPILLNF